MVGVAPQPEYRVICRQPLNLVGGDERLCFEVDGKPKAVALKIGQLNRRLVGALPDKALDLIEIAALVYAIDAAVSRGGLTDQRMAVKWYRRFIVEIPVLDLALWRAPDVKNTLEETLMFLSGDRFEFIFVQREGGRSEQTRFFEYGKDTAWTPDTVMMFSGGLDSFAGALEEIIDRKNKVALISHFSSNKIAPIQRALQQTLAERLGKDKAMHFPMRVNLRQGTNAEGTHRTRSFLFAALGVVTAFTFGKDKVSFYENGIVSLNLPPVGNVLATRATRTTHPQTLSRFTDLFSLIFATSMRIDNPFFWRTKTDVLETVSRLGMSDQVAYTRSCADVHNQTTQYSHCGKCSQCIDRRFAVLASGLERFDPSEAYRVDLMEGVRTRVQDREAALSFLRCAAGYEAMTHVDLERQFPAILSAVMHLDEPVQTAIPRLSGLLKRHGTAVCGVMRKVLQHRPADHFPEGSLPCLFGDIQRQQSFGSTLDHRGIDVSVVSHEKLKLTFDKKRKVLVIDEGIELRGASYELMLCLAEAHLRATGKGIDPLDFPFLSKEKLCNLLDLDSEEALRRRVSTTRKSLAAKAETTGLRPEQGRGLIENLPWHGYRLLSEMVIVRMIGD